MGAPARETLPGLTRAARRRFRRPNRLAQRYEGHEGSRLPPRRRQSLPGAVPAPSREGALGVAVAPAPFVILVIFVRTQIRPPRPPRRIGMPAGITPARSSGTSEGISDAVIRALERKAPS
jgi:hypothetical protein